MSGIYAIVNNANGKRYIGLSQDVNKRMRIHESLLRKQQHVNLHLQNAWNKYGDENFSFTVLERIANATKETLAKREIYYIQNFDSYENGYNQSMGGETTSHFRHTEETKEFFRQRMVGNTFSLGVTRSEETKLKMSLGFKRRKDLKEHSQRGRRTLKKLWKEEDFREKVLALNKGNTYNLGKKLSKEHVKLISDRQRGKGNSFYGKRHTEDSLRIMSEKSKANWKNENYRNKVMSKLRETMDTEEYKHKISLTSRGEKNNQATVKEIDVIKIRIKYLKGEKLREIAKDYPELTKSGLSKIYRAETWKHIPNNIEDLECMLINYQS